MKKQLVACAFVCFSTTYGQPQVCVDKAQVEQVTQALKNISAALAVLAHKVELVLGIAEQQTYVPSTDSDPTRTIDFEAWNDLIKNQPRDETQRTEQS